LTGTATFILRKEGINTPIQVIAGHDLSIPLVEFNASSPDFEVAA